MNIKEIVIENVKKSNADGLCNTEYACGCPTSNLFICCSVEGECEPAKVYTCAKCGENVYIPIHADSKEYHHDDCGGALDASQKIKTQTE